MEGRNSQKNGRAASQQQVRRGSLSPFGFLAETNVLFHGGKPRRERIESAACGAGASGTREFDRHRGLARFPSAMPGGAPQGSEKSPHNRIETSGMPI